MCQRLGKPICIIGIYLVKLGVTLIVKEDALKLAPLGVLVLRVFLSEKDA